MKDQNQHIKDIFGDKLGGFEAPVDAGVWSSIESSISTNAATAGSAGASAGAGSISVGVKIAIAIAAVAAFTTAIILLNPSAPEPTSQESPVAKVIESLDDDSPIEDQMEVEVSPLDNSSYEVIVQPAKTETKEQVVILDEDPVDVYHSEEISSASIARGAPQIVNPPVKETVPAVEQPVESSQIAEDKVVVEITAEFTVWRDPDNPMRFTFTPVMALAEGYQWAIDDMSVSTAKNLNYEFSEAGNYMVKLTTALGESTSLPQEADIAAYKKPKVVVPNVISPNGDNWNDELDLKELSINVSIESVMVYDVTGALVFESSPERLNWVGLDRFGEPCAEGNYVCIYQALGIDQKPHVGREIVSLER
jgi:hypothetical protein